MPIDIYGGKDPADVPAYTLRAAARLAGVPETTLKQWIKGRSFPTKSRGRQRSDAVLITPEPGFLSFTNVVEAHILSGLRKDHKIKLEKIRDAVRFLTDRLHVTHPLARERFKTDGVDLFVEHLGKLLNVSREGQTAWKEVIESHLREIEYERGRAVRFFPLYREVATRVVEVDPKRSFGRPVLAGTSVPIASIFARFQQGDTIQQLAGDYEVEPATIEEALRAIRQAA